MWERKETGPWGSESTGAQPATPRVESSPTPPRREDRVVSIGRTIRVEGELTGSEDLAIEGQVNGKVDIRDHHLTIGASGKIRAEVSAKAVVVQGEVHGNIRAAEKVELTPSSRVEGDLAAPRIVIADGAHFKGSVDTSEGDQASRSASPAPPKGAKEKGREKDLPDKVSVA